MPEIESSSSSTTAPSNSLKGFAQFFKGYMGVMPIVTAAVAPVLTALKAIPIYDSLRWPLATYSGLLGFLMLAWVFYARHAFGRALFSANTLAVAGLTPVPDSFSSRHRWAQRARALVLNSLPLILIVGSAVSYYVYFRLLASSVSQTIWPNDPVAAFKVVRFPPYFAQLMAWYMGIFLFAELAFIVMAMREYIQEMLHITDVRLITGQDVG